jgi:hypothetical protein
MDASDLEDSATDFLLFAVADHFTMKDMMGMKLGLCDFSHHVLCLSDCVRSMPNAK